MKFDEWKRLIASADPSDRYDAADEIPEGASPEQLAPYLIACLQDESELVRAAAADTLGCFETNEVRLALQQAISKETDMLARAYLISSLGAVANIEDLATFQRTLSMETDQNVRVHSAEALAFCSTRIAMAEFSKGITSMGTVKTASANLLDEYLSALCAHLTLLARDVAGQLENDSLSTPERVVLGALLEKIRKITAT